MASVGLPDSGTTFPWQSAHQNLVYEKTRSQIAANHNDHCGVKELYDRHRHHIYLVKKYYYKH